MSRFRVPAVAAALAVAARPRADAPRTDRRRVSAFSCCRMSASPPSTKALIPRRRRAPARSRRRRRRARVRPGRVIVKFRDGDGDARSRAPRCAPRAPAATSPNDHPTRISTSSASIRATTPRRSPRCCAPGRTSSTRRRRTACTRCSCPTIRSTWRSSGTCRSSTSSGPGTSSRRPARRSPSRSSTPAWPTRTRRSPRRCRRFSDDDGRQYPALGRVDDSVLRRRRSSCRRPTPLDRRAARFHLRRHVDAAARLRRPRHARQRHDRSADQQRRRHGRRGLQRQADAGEGARQRVGPAVCRVHATSRSGGTDDDVGARHPLCGRQRREDSST